MVDKEAAAVGHMMALAHMIAIVGQVLARMIAAVRMMVAEHGLPEYCYSYYSSASPPRMYFCNQYTLKGQLDSLQRITIYSEIHTKLKLNC